MQGFEVNNKKIAKNTLYLYFRMLLVVGVSLYTYRIVLFELGVEDYGIYNVVGGVVVMFSFLNSSMASSTQRFFTFDLGRGDLLSLKKTFSASLNIHIILGVIIFILSETIGLWFVNTKLVIPTERIWSANIVFQGAILGFVASVIQVPFNASIIAHEQMNIYAYFSIFEVLSKLFIAFILGWYTGDKLILYAILILVAQILTTAFYVIYCLYNYKECRFGFVKDSKMYKTLVSFAGWSLFGSFAWIARGQGVNIVLNMFLGPLLNAARGVSDSVSSTVVGFVKNINTAITPQITKSYASGSLQEMELLNYRGIKYSFLLLYILAFPIMLNIDYILNIWLVEVPDYSSIFVVLVLVDALAEALLGASQFQTSLFSTGNIKISQIVVGLIILLVIPFSYLLLRAGYSPISVFIAMIVVTLVSSIVRFVFCRMQIGFSLVRLIRTVWVPSIVLVLLSSPIPIVLRFTVLGNDNFGSFFITSICSVIIIISLSWFIVFDSFERGVLEKYIIQKINSKRK